MATVVPSGGAAGETWATHGVLPRGNVVDARVMTDQGPGRARVLVVDDDPIVSEAIGGVLRAAGYDAVCAPGGDAALEMIQRDGTPDVIVADLLMPGMDGLALVRELRERRVGSPVVMLTGYATVESAVASFRLGVMDYLPKPVDDAVLCAAIERAMQRGALHTGTATGVRCAREPQAIQTIVGEDARMQRVFELVGAVAPSRTTVLMSGESGTGKSLIAHAIHRQSERSAGPYVELSCGSIPETLLESELFGHVKGSFTGAHTDKVGKFAAADGGTIFLDEINSASAAMQLKLLRVLQERRFEPVGLNETVHADVRVVLASNEPLDRLVAEGRFRQDLYYRINVVQIDLPPLRERLGDVPVLAAFFLRQHAQELGRELIGFTDEAMAALTSYAYPGNVRELQNIVERAAVLTMSPTVGVETLPTHVLGDGSARTPGYPGEQAPGTWEPMALAEALLEPERRIILRALEANGWNRSQTAEDLEINRTTLYKKMKSLGIEERVRRAAG